MQSDYPNVFGTSGDDRPDETTDPGIATIPPGGTDPALESVLTDTTWDLRYVGADAATPAQGQSPRLGFQSGASLKPMLERAQPVYAVSGPTLGPTEQIAPAVTGPSVGLADLEMMLKHLLPAVPAQAPPPRLAPKELEAMLKRLLPGTLTQAPQPRGLQYCASPVAINATGQVDARRWM